MKLLVCATPKAGNNWLKFILHEIYELDLLDWNRDHCQTRENWVAHEHMPPDTELLRWMRETGVVPVTILRHPVDVLVSYYHYVHMKVEVPDEELGILRDTCGPGEGTLEFARHHFYRLMLVSDLWRMAGAAFVRYEDLVSNPIATLKGLTNEIQPVSDEAIRRAIVCASFDLLKAENAAKPFLGVKSGKNFFRSGKTGQVNEVSVGIRALLASSPYAEFIAEAGYDLVPSRSEIFDVASIDPFQGHRQFSNGVTISPMLYKLLTRIDNLGPRWERPWDSMGPSSLYHWLNASCDDHPGSVITNLLALIYARRRDLQLAFPDPYGADLRGFCIWFLSQGCREYGLVAEFMAPIRRKLLSTGVMRL